MAKLHIPFYLVTSFFKMMIIFKIAIQRLFLINVINFFIFIVSKIYVRS